MEGSINTQTLMKLGALVLLLLVVSCGESQNPALKYGKVCPKCDELGVTPEWLVQNNRRLSNGNVLEDGVEYKPIYWPGSTGVYCPKGMGYRGPISVKIEVRVNGKLGQIMELPTIYLCPGGTISAQIDENNISISH